MSSVLRATSQISKSSGSFVTLVTTGFIWTDVTVGSATLLEGLTAVTAANGLVRATGTNFVFGTAAQAIAAGALGGGPAGYASRFPTVVGKVYRDLGKNIYIYVQGASGTAPPLLFVVLTRVMQMSADSTDLSEGDAGQVGYIITWSAYPTAPTNIAVARVGSGHSF